MTGLGAYRRRSAYTGPSGHREEVFEVKHGFFSSPFVPGEDSGEKEKAIGTALREERDTHASSRGGCEGRPRTGSRFVCRFQPASRRSG